jgi:integrase
MGHLYQRGPIWWFQFYQDGQRQRMTSESTDENVAKRMLKEHEARVTLKEPVVAQAARVTYDELRADLVAHYQATGSRDLAEAGCRLTHLDRAFRGVRASRITGAAITEYIVQRQSEEIVSPKKKQRRRPANGTINREVAVLLKLLRLGVERNKVARLPIVHKPEENPARQGFLEPAAFEAVRAHLPLDIQLAVTLLYDNAWRLREVTHLLLRQVDLDAGCLRLDPGQAKSTGDPRTVYLRPDTLARLRAHVERVRALERATGRVIPYLFPIFPGSGIRHALVGTQRDNFERAWARACRAAGYPGRLVHDLRRSGIRNLVRAGVPERVVMSISGHRSRSTFDRYNITSETDLQAAAAQLDAARKAAAATKTPDSATVTALPTTRKARTARS